jgi:putative ABC transport system substrate-binding protein
MSKGGLVCYATDVLDLYRLTAGYVVRIFAGPKPGDLSIQQPTKFELVINLKTAKALGLDVPPALLVRADEVRMRGPMLPIGTSRRSSPA